MVSFNENNGLFQDLASHRLAEDKLFAGHNGIRVTKVTKTSAEGEFTLTNHSLNPLGIVHGGALASLADTVAGVAATIATKSPCVTVNYAMNFLRPVPKTAKKVFCLATARKMGRTLCIYEISLSDDSGTIVATGDFTFFVNPQRLLPGVQENDKTPPPPVTT